MHGPTVPPIPTPRNHNQHFFATTNRRQEETTELLSALRIELEEGS